MKKLLAFAIIILFIGSNIVSGTSIQLKNTTIPLINSRGYIQDLINIASDGDTIYIPSGIYYENIIINKSISLVGEDKDTTIIDGGNKNDVVIIFANWVNVSGFTIRRSRDDSSGIAIHSNYNTIKNNKISSGISHEYGITLHWNSGYNSIKNNIISFNREGVYLRGSNANIVSGNIISNNYYGIDIYSSNNNKIMGNNITLNRWYGIFCYGNNNDNISSNIISYNGEELSQHGGILLRDCYKYKILKNNFINNSRNGYFINFPFFLFFEIFIKNIWNENYWDKPRYFPYFIFGVIFPIFGKIKFPWVNFDWHPAKEPYDIGV